MPPYNHEELTAIRKRHFGNVHTFSAASGLSTDAIGNVERGYRNIQARTFRRYCEALGLVPEEYILPDFPHAGGTGISLLSITPPSTINFRPIKHPSTTENTWRSSQMVAILSRYNIQAKRGLTQPVTIDTIQMIIHGLPNKRDEDSTFSAQYWVRLDNSRNHRDYPELTPDTIWRGETSHRQQGATIRAFELEPGKSEDHEIMFSNDSGDISWSSFIDNMGILADAGLKIELRVATRDHYGNKGLGKAQFFVSSDEFKKMQEKLSNPNLTYGYPSYIQAYTEGVK